MVMGHVAYFAKVWYKARVMAMKTSRAMVTAMAAARAAAKAKAEG